ncbi:MAG TPA: 4-(cytidine 5'-diphospho)-2-C-methyl-D-erythritol kinase [Rhodospirillales bacterium]|jgi:4-diphosphocytidyl-2-C-methyl-D-erythritol kinase|nr:4-(cytidine 5'-diphospho)-2-C-methyl-D-erythritol kinase [Rhodospirillales bacterium]
MADQTVSAIAPAKINLYLHVVGKRSDGYHFLDSLVVFAGLQDLISAAPAKDLSLAIDGPFSAGLPKANDNLVLKTARQLTKAMDVRKGAAIRLTKRLPVAAGMGGGSADAAAALKILARLWNLNPANDALMGLAARLGVDVPVCLNGQAAFVGGIGEKITAAPPLPPAWLVLVNPGVALSTPEVFGHCNGDFSKEARFTDAVSTAEDLAAVLQTRGNDLTEAATALEPVIGDVLEALNASQGALLARMTGSGSTCFGLFADPDTATRAATALTQNHPGWWVKAASLVSDTTRPAN